MTTEAGSLERHDESGSAAGPAISDPWPRRRTLVRGALELQYLGFLYVPGHLAGDESAQQLLTDWTVAGPAQAAASVRGRFLAAVHDTATGIHHTFVDDAGMFPAYHLGATVSPSFRRLALEAPDPGLTVDPERAMELMLYGFISGDRTPCPGIRRLGARDILEAGSGAPRMLAKTLVSLDDPTGLTPGSLHDSFAALAHAVSRMSISVDLTGGVDSRLVATYLDADGVAFEAALSAWPDHEDAIGGRAVAAALGHPYLLTEPPAGPSIDLDAVYAAGDAMIGSLEAVARKGRLQLERRRRGIELAIDGTGGELYKDFWWLQDFPLYSRRRPSIGRLYDLRIEPERLPLRLLSGSGAKVAEAVRRDVLERLAASPGRRNTEVYDQIYFERMRGASGLLSAASEALGGLDTYSPLLEFERVRFAYHLPRRERIFDWFHRREISRLSPAAAALTTTRGGTAEAGSLLRVGLPYAVDLAGRAVGKASQRLLGRRVAAPAAPGDPAGFAESLRRTEPFRAAVEGLVDLGLLSRDLQPERVPPTFVGRVYVAGRFLEEFRAGHGSSRG